MITDAIFLIMILLGRVAAGGLREVRVVDEWNGDETVYDEEYWRI